MRFDEVVLATHSDQALAMLADPSDAEREVLGAIGYQPNDVVLHTDRSLLPRRPRAWASWNYPPPGRARCGRTTVTYHMNRLQTLDADREFCVTLNRSADVDPATVIRSLRYDHPGLHARGARRAGALGRGERAAAHPLLRRLLGLRVPRGRGGVRAAGVRAFRGCAR